MDVFLSGDIGGYIDLLKSLKAGVDDNTIPSINWKEIRPFLAMEHFTVEIIQSKNSAAAGVCSFVLNIVMVGAWVKVPRLMPFRSVNNTF